MVETADGDAVEFPEPQHRGPGGSIRWALGTRDGARSSQSWSIFGSKDHDDVYIGLRTQSGVIKLSLHESAIWRMAWSDQGAPLMRLSDDEDRVLDRWPPPPTIALGWRHAVSVHLSNFSLRTNLDEPGLGKVALYPAPDPDDIARFMLLLAEPGAADLTVNSGLDVGSLRLPGGGMVGLVMDYQPMDPAAREKIEELRAHILEAATAAGAHGNRGFAWGSLADGAVLLVDPGEIEPPGTGRCGPPGRITYVRRVDRAG
jgi:hypothetical protein